MVWSNPHLVMDGWSRTLVFKEVLDRYYALCCGEEINLHPAPSYREYIVWLQERDKAAAEDFWRRSLKGLSGPTLLRVERPAAAGADPESYPRQELRLSSTTTESLLSLAREHRLTLNTLLQGAWAILINRYSGEEAVVFGSTTSGRSAPLPGIDAMVGMLANTLPLRVRVPRSEATIQWLKRLQEQLIELRHHEHSSLIDIQAWAEVPRGVALFDNIFVFENQGLGELAFQSTAGL